MESFGIHYPRADIGLTMVAVEHETTLVPIPLHREAVSHREQRKIYIVPENPDLESSSEI